MANNDIRAEVRSAGLKLWQVADRLGLADCNFSRLLRHELPEDKKAKIRKVIADLVNEDNHYGE